MECELWPLRHHPNWVMTGFTALTAGCRIDAMDPRLGIDYRTLNPASRLAQTSRLPLR